MEQGIFKVKNREEERWIITNDKLSSFLEEIKNITIIKNFSTNYNHTIYFNNQNHELPFCTSIKARRYSQNKFNGSIDLNEEWIFELKEEYISQKSHLKKKKRESLTILEIINNLASSDIYKKYHLNFPLLPYVADSYKRSHYDVIGQDDFRITIDSDLEYYFFNSKTETSFLNQENYTRIEIKIPEEKLNPPELQIIRNSLNKLKAIPVVSKKDMAYNFVYEYLINKSNHHIHEFDIEIEAKLTLEEKDQYLFSKIYDDFKKGTFENFEILKSFSYIVEKGKLHQYIIGDGNPTRISIKGDKSVINTKSNLEILKDEFNLNCIIKRKEISKKYENINFQAPSRILYRKRKFFIVKDINVNDGYNYSITLDRCTYNGKEIFQIEVEGLLLSTDKNQEQKIINDISHIVYKLLQRYPSLKPTIITKEKWIKSV